MNLKQFLYFYKIEIKGYLWIYDIIKEKTVEQTVWFGLQFIKIEVSFIFMNVYFKM